jgi:hypothetical protein
MEALKASVEAAKRGEDPRSASRKSTRKRSTARKKTTTGKKKTTRKKKAS